MIANADLAVELRGYYPRLLKGPLLLMGETEQDIFRLRFEQHLADILRPLLPLYGHRPDFELWVHKFLEIAAQAYADRSGELRLLDLARVSEPD